MRQSMGGRAGGHPGHGDAGRGRMVGSGEERERALGLLAAKYEQ